MQLRPSSCRFYSPFALTTLILVNTQIASSKSGELLNAPITTFFVPQGAQPQDEILADFPLRVNEGDEDVAISLDPPSNTITISPPIAGPDTPIHLLVVDPLELRKRGGEKLKLQALALITGKEEEIPIEIRIAPETIHSSGQRTEGIVPPFEKDHYELFLEHGFSEREIAIVKLKSELPTDTELTLYGPLSERFTITNEGQLVYLTTIPCEHRCSTPKTFVVLLEAIAGNSQQITTLRFKSKDVSGLRFHNTPYSATVEEKTGLFEKAVKLVTSGSEGDVMYTLQDTTGLFSIHPKTGVLMVQHPEFLTRSGYGSMVNLTATATDKKGSVTTPIYVKLVAVAQRLESFHFEKDSYTFAVPPGESLVGVVELVGAENHTVQYAIAEGAQGAFSVDDGGALYYRREPEKDSRNFTLLVTARSTEGQFFVATTWVEVTVEGIQSHPLKINGSSQRSSALRANTKIGATVATFELSDDDNDATVQLTIEAISGIALNGSAVEGLQQKIFKVRMDKQRADLILSEPIHDLPVVSLNLQLSARDLSHPNEPAVEAIQTFVIVRDHRLVTEAPLLFKFVEAPKTIKIPASTPEGSLVYRPTLLQSVITSTSDIAYEIDSSSDAFEIDNRTGTAVATVTAKWDNEEVENTYAVEGADAMYFTIDNQGTIRLKESVAKVPRSELNFVVRAGEATSSTTAPIHVVLASYDEMAEFEFEKGSYEVKVMENLPANGYVIQPKLTNAELTEVEYSLETSNEATVVKKLLRIDSGGRIYANEELQGYAGTYFFQVRAAKGERRASADVLLHILAAYKCAPTFIGDGNFEFTIEENSPVGTAIGTVSAGALDNKCEMKYQLWDPTNHEYTNQTKIASINIETGEILSRIKFDHEELSMYPLVLGLQAGAHQFAQMASSVRVLDVDDHPLEAMHDSLTVEVPEDVTIGTVIATATAVDDDESQSVFYRLRDQSKEFAVNATSGEVTVVSELDREVNDSYRIEIGASNKEDASVDDVAVWMELHIQVKDVNDNGPLFENSRYYVLVGKRTLPGEKILTVSASDPDQPNPGSNDKRVFYGVKEVLFEYHGMSRAMQGIFSITSTGGIVTLSQPVSDFVGGVFHLLLESMDSLEADAHKDQSIVKVYIHDDSDIVRLDLPLPPAAVTYEKVNVIRKTVADATGLNVFVKDLQYHHEEGHLIYDVTDLRLVLVNRTSSEIIPAERAIAIADKHRSVMGDRLPSMTKAQVFSSPVVRQSVPPLAYVLGVFALSLTFIFMVFGFMMCHYRNKFRREKKLREDDIVIANALNRPPLRPMKLSPPLMHTQSFAPHIPAIDGTYAVQEMKMVVAGDDGRRSKPW
ncbi:hypothetical protein Q1695_012095 [Nippostrongylus brasiliensis]|nr:hypothetical protein Q1695_012095 [Nippostrongylus brasiliensis]